MIVIPKKGEVTELILSEAAMRELGLSEGQAVEIALPETPVEPYDDSWLEDDNVPNLPAWLQPKESRERLKRSMHWARTTPRKSTTLEEIDQLLKLDQVNTSGFNWI